MWGPVDGHEYVKMDMPVDGMDVFEIAEKQAACSCQIDQPSCILDVLPNKEANLDVYSFQSFRYWEAWFSHFISENIDHKENSWTQNICS